MKVKYKQLKGSRFTKNFRSIWKEEDYSHVKDCNSVRAFRRELKKLPKGVKYILLNLWQNYDAYGVGGAK